MAKYKDKNREREINRNYYYRHRERILAKRNEYLLTNVGQIWKRDKQLWTKYRIRYIDYLKLIAKQKFKCDICKREFSNKLRKYVDHNHDTGEVRSILCNRCNVHIGWIEEYKTDILNYIK